MQASPKGNSRSIYMNILELGKFPFHFFWEMYSIRLNLFVLFWHTCPLIGSKYYIFINNILWFLTPSKKFQLVFVYKVFKIIKNNINLKIWMNFWDILNSENGQKTDGVLILYHWIITFNETLWIFYLNIQPKSLPILLRFSETTKAIIQAFKFLQGHVCK